MPILPGLIERIWLRVGPVLNLDMGSGSRRLSQAPALGHHARLFDGLRNGPAEQSRIGLAGDLTSSAQMILEGTNLPDQ
jgi:hypothetical protein